MALYVVATPIGNLGDITLRAVETLRAVDRVAAEDTRRTRTLLAHLGIENKPLTSLEAHATDDQINRMVDRLSAGENVALLTDAGTPSVSDPGAALVEASVRARVRVVPIPGASAVTTAVAASGLVRGAFRFFGFLPRKGTERAEALTQIAATPEPVVLFEAPQRAAATLTELALLCPERALVIAREMTKMYEEFLRGTVAELADPPRAWQGEITLVLGADAGAGRQEVDDAAISARITDAVSKGEPAKAAAMRIAAWAGKPRREIYALLVQAAGKKEP